MLPTSTFQRESFFHSALLLCICLLIYGGIWQNGWHLDDFGNILNNTALHITDIHPATLFTTFYAHPEETGRLYRPISNFSFALNWFFNQDRTEGYHLVDIFIHFFTAVMLYFSTLLLLQSPALQIKNWSETYRENIAILSTVLWVSAPIHTSAVTYIVQRMAQLAAFFSISAIYCYLKARLHSSRTQQIIFVICFFCCALLALGSKENAVLLFPSILLIEGIFFLQFQRILSFARKNTYLFLFFFLTVTVLAVFFSWNFIEAQSLNYEHRSFTLSERILTEPRILLFYLSQIFFPSVSRLSIAHDIVLSVSLFSPWQTSFAILSCIGLIIFSLFSFYKRPLIAFAILYFFLNHLVESTVLPLELIFEHRNLLPSFFLFLPVATFVVNYIYHNKWATVFCNIACTAFLLQSGLATVERNKAWKDAGTINQDAISKAPNDARSKLNLATWYIQQKKYNEALNLISQAEKFRKNEATINTTIPIALDIRGTIAYEKGEIKKAKQYFHQAYYLRKDYTAVAEKLIAILVELEYYDEALAIISERYAIKKDPKLLLLKASILLRQNKPTASLAVYSQASQFYADLPLITAGKGKAFILLGQYNQADMLLDTAVQQNEPIAKLLQIENSLLFGADQKAYIMINQLIKTIPLVNLIADIDAAKKDSFQIPLNKKLLQQAVLDAAAIMSPSS